MSEIPTPVKLAVDGRDKQRCVRCGKWLSNNGSRHHRQRRSVGGHLVANVILLCGSGTTGCHGWAHSMPATARAEGIIVATYVPDVAAVPIRVLDIDVSLKHIYVLLSADGQRTQIPEAEALLLLAAVI